MFLNKADDKDARALVKLLSQEAKAREKEGFRAFVYFLDGTPEGLKKLNRELNADNIALALLPQKERKKTLEIYKINPKAESTVLVHRSGKVTKTFANYDPEKDASALRKAIEAICE